MIKKANFVSKRNYYLVNIFDVIFKLLWFFCSILHIVRNKEPIKGRVVCIGPTHIGDLLLSTPAIRFLKTKRPSLQIYCIVSTSSRHAYTNNTNVKGTEIIDLPWFKEGTGGVLHALRAFFKLASALKSIRAETAVNFSSTAYHREHLALWLAGIPQRIGFSHKGFGYFLTTEVPFVRNELIPKQKLRILTHWLNEQLGGYDLGPDYFISQNAAAEGQNIFQSLGLDRDKTVIGLNISAQHNFLWPDAYWIKLCNLLYYGLGVQMVFLGTLSAKESIEKIRATLQFKTFSAAGKTTLEGLAAMLKYFEVLITVDTGIRHLANAVGLKTIVIKHSADSIHEFGRYTEYEQIVNHLVSCSPCGLKRCRFNETFCMTGITPEKCFEATQRIIKASP